MVKKEKKKNKNSSLLKRTTDLDKTYYGNSHDLYMRNHRPELAFTTYG